MGAIDITLFIHRDRRWRLNLDRVTWNSRRHCNINALNYTPRFELLATTGQCNTVMITILLQYHSNCHNNINAACESNTVKQWCLFITIRDRDPSSLNDLIFFISRQASAYSNSLFLCIFQRGVAEVAVGFSLSAENTFLSLESISFLAGTLERREDESLTRRKRLASLASREDRVAPSFVAAPDDLGASRRRHPRLVDSRNVVAGARRVAYLSRPSLPERVFHLYGEYVLGVLDISNIFFPSLIAVISFPLRKNLISILNSILPRHFIYRFVSTRKFHFSSHTDILKLFVV